MYETFTEIKKVDKSLCDWTFWWNIECLIIKDLQIFPVFHKVFFVYQRFAWYFVGHPDASFFFHPYRKPKRIRTAFSPSQLLKLEHAFEKNHYVVGQERKDLAAKLGLTETQVSLLKIPDLNLQFKTDCRGLQLKKQYIY